MEVSMDVIVEASMEAGEASIHGSVEVVENFTEAGSMEVLPRKYCKRL